MAFKDAVKNAKKKGGKPSFPPKGKDGGKPNPFAGKDGGNPFSGGQKPNPFAGKGDAPEGGKGPSKGLKNAFKNVKKKGGKR